ncbi:MAG: hypothetical protein BWY76_00181 [bacterium ADurb.Bin429]|nr:MAG: hypothetical protein BWY76_00181 [bacterium ADurb.Bin429]
MSEDLDLSGVLSQLKRADEALTEFVAPLWPGVRLAAAWMEHGPKLFRVAETPAEEEYYLLGTLDDVATVLRPADDAEISKYLNYLGKAKVILLPEGLAYPATFAERLQGITGPRPIHFAPEAPLTEAQARFDGVNLLYDRAATERPKEDLFGGLLAESSIFTPGELLDTPGDGAGGAEETVRELDARPEKAIEARLTGVLDSAGAILEEWSLTDDGVRLRWRHLDEEHAITLAQAASTITSGICLPGARHFDPARLARLLLDHVLDTWRS